jgi:cystathionine beta-lyase/cystathionine gamma-synthase
MGFATDAIHVGQEPDAATGAIVPPIYQTSTYVQEALGKNKGFDYARTAHPNRRALERCVVVSEAVYGGVYRLITQLLTHFGLEFSFVDTSDLAAVRKAIRPATKMIYVETPTNPTMIITDIAAAAGIAKEHKLILAVDNTFLSPYLQQPILLGAHIVVHSMTKYLNGHSDATGGAAILTRPEDAERIYFVQRSAGAGLAPMDCFLVARGIKTLAVRMRQHDDNGMAVARFLESHPKVKRVLYPGLPSHPQHEIARRQQRGFGAMISFDLGTLEAARRLLDHVKLCSLAESLGGVETLISHPASMTHASIPPEVRKQTGITDGLVRISVGIEDAEDLIADLDAALAKV